MTAGPLSRREWLALALAGLCSPARRASAAVDAPPRWQTLPATPTLPTPSRAGIAEVGGAAIHFAQFGGGPHVLMLHGGLANSNWWGLQVGALAARHTVTVMDTRGHGRSPYGGERLGYSLFASDAVGLLDALGIGEAGLVGWSDGAITALLVAAAAPARVGHLFAFGANVSRAGLIPGGARSPTFRAFAARCAAEYRQLSPRPERWPRLLSALGRMWRDEPGVPADALARIACPTLVADGRHDEIIRPEHAAAIAGRIRGGRTWIEPDASHFAMLQAPDAFTAALVGFLAA